MQSFQEDDTVMLLRGPSNLFEKRQSLALGSVISEANESRFLNDSDLTVLPGEISRYAGDGTISKYGNSEPLEALHEQFHEILELHKGKRSSFELVKDFTSICVSFMQSQPQGSDIEQWLCDENNTWRLLHILMEDRLNYEYIEDDSAMAEYDIPVSEKEIMLEVFRKDPVTRQSQLVVDWLEACESSKRAHHQTLRAEHFTDKTVSWENTILQIRQKDDIAYSSNAQLVTEIDPDAPVRQGRHIHKLDAEDEVLLLSQILSHIRCGQLEQAQKLCIHCGQPWRAATLEGWRLYHNPNIAKGGDENKKEGFILPTEGNPNRDVWKLAAWSLAEDKRMPSCARTTYAALCGHLEAMLLNMDTWHDWLWAYLRTMIDVRIEEEIRDKTTRNYVDMPSKYWVNKMNLAQIFAALASSPVAQVRSEHAKELTCVQRFLILDDMNSLYATLSSWSRQVTDFRNPLSALLIRFSAHLVLVLRSMGKEITESCNNHGNEVLRVYSRFIISLGSPNLIMSYVAKLPKEDQVATLAQYLETVTDVEKKAHCLELAGKEGLDAEAAAQSVVESIRARELKRNGDLLRGEATEEDLAKIEALDWLVVYPSQYSEALWQANALVRQFIASGKLDAARAAFGKLPTQTVNIILQDQLKEYPDIDDLDASMSPRHRSAVREYLSLKLYLVSYQS